MPDLLESIKKPSDPVKEELRQKLIKITQFESKIKKIRVCTFQMSGKIRDSANVASEAVIPSNSNTLLQYLAPLGAKYMEKRLKKYKKMRVLARRAGYPSIKKAKLSSRDQVGC